MKSVDLKDNTYINTDKEVNNKDPKFQLGDHVKYILNIVNYIFLLKDILKTDLKNYQQLLAIEALFIREIKSKLNTKDEYRIRELAIKF